MENAADALKMAAAILIFVLAIGASFSLFGTAKQTTDSIITMRDKQAYLEAAELDNGILYTSTEALQSEDAAERFGVTQSGHRIVTIDDVVSTIYRYNKEKYGISIIIDGKVLARFDSSTESVVRQWNNIGQDNRESYISQLKSNISNEFISDIGDDFLDLDAIYSISINGEYNTCGAPWYGNDEEIRKRILVDLYGKTYKKNNQIYEGKNIVEKVTEKGGNIIEITKEIDQSTYLKDGDEKTNLLQQYEMPVLEIIYIVE